MSNLKRKDHQLHFYNELIEEIVQHRPTYCGIGNKRTKYGKSTFSAFVNTLTIAKRFGEAYGMSPHIGSYVGNPLLYYLNEYVFFQREMMYSYAASVIYTGGLQKGKHNNRVVTRNHGGCIINNTVSRKTFIKYGDPAQREYIVSFLHELKHTDPILSAPKLISFCYSPLVLTLLNQSEDVIEKTLTAIAPHLIESFIEKGFLSNTTSRKIEHFKRTGQYLDNAPYQIISPLNSPYYKDQLDSILNQSSNLKRKRRADNNEMAQIEKEILEEQQKALESAKKRTSQTTNFSEDEFTDLPTVDDQILSDPITPIVREEADVDTEKETSLSPLSSSSTSPSSEKEERMAMFRDALSQAGGDWYLNGQSKDNELLSESDVKSIQEETLEEDGDDIIVKEEKKEEREKREKLTGSDEFSDLYRIDATLKK